MTTTGKTLLEQLNKGENNSVRHMILNDIGRDTNKKLRYRDLRAYALEVKQPTDWLNADHRILEKAFKCSKLNDTIQFFQNKRGANSNKECKEMEMDQPIHWMNIAREYKK